jgi:hypothetical protein
MSADLDHSGDYGYDLVQEVKASLQIPSRRKRQPVSGIRATGHRMDVDGDYGYDMVHEQ